MSPGRSQFTNVQFLDEAADDLRQLLSTNRVVALEVFRLLRELDRGNLRPTPLQDFSKTGNLTDCGKIVVALAGEPEYRIVVRGNEGRFEVCEVVTIANRADDLPYLLAGIRLGRLQDPVRRSDAQKRIHRIRNLRRD